MNNSTGNVTATDGLPVEVQLGNGGHFNAFLMDIINGEALIRFPSDWMPKGKYPLSQVRFPPGRECLPVYLEENMVAEILMANPKGFRQAWFKCLVKSLNFEVCQFEYIDNSNSIQYDTVSGQTRNLRKPNTNTSINMDLLYVHKIPVSEGHREAASWAYANATFKPRIKFTIQNYDAASGELVLISRNAAAISAVIAFEEAYFKYLSQLTVNLSREKALKLKLTEDGGFIEELVVLQSHLKFVTGDNEMNLCATRMIEGIFCVQVLDLLSKIMIYGKTEAAMIRAHNSLIIKRELYPVPKELLSELVEGESAPIHEIIEKSGVAEIFVKGIKKGEEEQDRFLCIVGIAQTINKATNMIKYQINHMKEMYLLRQDQNQQMRLLSALQQQGIVVKFL